MSIRYYTSEIFRMACEKESKDSRLLQEAICLLERQRDGLLYPSEKRVTSKQVNEFIARVRSAL